MDDEQDGGAGDANDAQQDQVSASLAALLVKLFGGFANMQAPKLPAAPLHARWRKMLGVPEGVSTYHALSELDRACERLRMQIEGLPGHFGAIRGHALEGLAAVRISYAFPALQGRVQDIQQHVTPEHLKMLTVASELLIAFAPESCPAEGVVPVILKQLDELETAVVASIFPEPVKNRLLVHLAQLRWAIANWHLVGGEPASSAVGSLVSSIAGAERQAPDAAEKANLRERALTIVDWVGRYQTAEAVYQGAKGLAPSVARLLGLSG